MIKPLRGLHPAFSKKKICPSFERITLTERDSKGPTGRWGVGRSGGGEVGGWGGRGVGRSGGPP